MHLPRTYLMTPLDAPRIWTPLVSLLVLLGLCLWGMAVWGPGRMWPLTSLVGVVFVLFLLGWLTEKVTFTEAGIHYRSLTAKYVLGWEEVAYWGYFRQARHGNSKLGKGDAMKGNIYLHLGSSQPPASPELFRVSEKHLVVYFREELASEFRARLGEPLAR